MSCPVLGSVANDNLGQLTASQEAENTSAHGAASAAIGMSVASIFTSEPRSPAIPVREKHQHRSSKISRARLRSSPGDDHELLATTKGALS
jgi:hypothetical protein